MDFEIDTSVARKLKSATTKGEKKKVAKMGKNLIENALEASGTAKTKKKILKNV